MLPPSDSDQFARKAKTAPSIWSFDSGYGTGDAKGDEREVSGVGMGAFYLQQSTSANSLQGRLDASANGIDLGLGLSSCQPQAQRQETLEPVVKRPNLFTAKDLGDGYLQQSAGEGNDCLTCEFWRSMSPGEDVRCEDCSRPDTVEPRLLLADGDHTTYPSLPYTLASPETKHTTRNLPTPSVPTRCSACELSAMIDPSGPSSCSSCSPSSSLICSNSSSVQYHKVKRSRAGRNSKLPLSALNRLQSWLDAHQDNPYPNAAEKQQLAQECGITEKQVTTWFTNARARQLSPLDTYLSSASEDEVAQESDIASAAQTPPYTSGFGSEMQLPAYSHRAGSISGSSAFSAGPNRPQASRRGKKKNYRRHSIQPPQITEHLPFDSPVITSNEHSTADSQELWQCTFCRATLVPKSWRRHEETQHRPRAQWTCMLEGPRVSRTNSGSTFCAFCMTKNPPEHHFQSNHRITECLKRPTGERTFFRPDHLRQHVKNFHGAGLFEIVQASWKRGPEDNGEGRKGKGEGFLCGFCGIRLDGWAARESHIAGHFKEGMRMSQWREDWPERDARQEQDAKSLRHEHQFQGEKEKEHSFARLRRSLTRRSTNKSSKSATYTFNQQEASSSSATVFSESITYSPPATSTPYSPHNIATTIRRSLTRRSTNKSTKSYSSSHQHDPSSSSFSNTANTILPPTTTTHTHLCTSTMTTMSEYYTTPLPDINLDPLIPDSAYLSNQDFDLMDWSLMASVPQYTDTNMMFTDADLDATGTLAGFDITTTFGQAGGSGSSAWGNEMNYHGVGGA